MKNCYPIQSCNHFMHRAFLLLTSLFLFLFVFSCGTQAYELNGTATGNILNNGYSAKTDDLFVYADIENGYALTIEKENEVIVADSDNAQSINIYNGKVYYITIDGTAKETVLRCYDPSAKDVSALLSVPLAEGMKNLLIVDEKALLISNGAVIAYDLCNGTVEKLWGTEVRQFLSVTDGWIYSVNGSSALYFRDENGRETLISEDALFFDASIEKLYYSDGESGIYTCDFNGEGNTRIADGGSDLVYSDDLYWKANGNLYSLSGGIEASFSDEESTSVTVLSDDILMEEAAVLPVMENEEFGCGSVLASDEEISLFSSGVSSLPAGDYKNWKQGDSRWSGNAMGSTTIGRSGCLAVGISILLVGSGEQKDRYLRGTFDPGVFVREMSANGGFDSGGGLYWGKISAVYPGFTVFRDTGKGTSSVFYNLNSSGQSSSIKNHLAEGRFSIICTNNGRTGNTHWLPVDYATDTGIFVCDPGYSTVASPSNVYTIGWYPKVTRAILFNYSGERWDGGNDVDPPAGDFYDWNNPFTDVEKKWYYNSIGEVYEAGLMVGTSKTTFEPDRTMTRAEFVCMAARLANVDFSSYEKVDFPDVKYDALDKWYSDYLPWAVATDIVEGIPIDGKTYFCPTAPVTREQICAILVRLAPRVNVDLSPTESLVSFADQKEVSPWAVESVKTAQLAGLIYGVPDYQTQKLYMKPLGYATRAEVASLILRFTRRLPVS